MLLVSETWVKEAPDRLVEDELIKLTDSQYKDQYSTNFLRAVDKSLSLYARDRHQDGFELQKKLLGQGLQVKKSKDDEKHNKLFEKRVHATGIKTEEIISKPSRKTGDTWTEPYTNMVFVWVPGGCFEMGDIFGGGNEDEHPVHKVSVDGFWIGKYPVTQGQWKKLIGSNPSYFKMGEDYPVEQVSWNDAQKFIKDLISKSSKDGFRLPTEAEWEYAARSGGKKEKYAGSNHIKKVAWYKRNSRGLFRKSTHPVGKKQPNGLGIYDMSGNVWEWVSDWYDSNYYSRSPRDNPQGPSRGSSLVYRGGDWDDSAWYCRTAYRKSTGTGSQYDSKGFRLALSPGQQ